MSQVRVTKAELEVIAPRIIETKDMREIEAAELLGLSGNQIRRARRALGVNKKTKLDASISELVKLGDLSCEEAADVLGLTRNQVSHLRSKNGLGRGAGWRKGIPPTTKRPIGSRRKSRGGKVFYEIKVADTGDCSVDWVPEHRYVWERAHGKPEDGWRVIALDGDYLNTELSNLYAVSKQVFANVGWHKWWFKNEPEKQLYAIKICELTTELSKQGFDFKKYYKDLYSKSRKGK